MEKCVTQPAGKKHHKKGHFLPFTAVLNDGSDFPSNPTSKQRTQGCIQWKEIKINHHALGWTSCLSAIFQRNEADVFFAELLFKQHDFNKSERETEKTGTYVFFNVVLSILSPMHGLASLTKRNRMIISSSDILCRAPPGGCAHALWRLTIMALLISGGIRRLMKWGELMSLWADATHPCVCGPPLTYRAPLSFGFRWPFRWSSI